MRKRNISVMFRMNRKEMQHLEKLVQRSGLSKEAFLRAMIAGYQLHEKPDAEFYDVMRQLSAIGNSLNQIARKANALGFVDAPLYQNEVKHWQKFQMDINKKYLLPEL